MAAGASLLAVALMGLPQALEAETVTIPESTLTFDLLRVPGGDGLPGFWMGKHEVSFQRFTHYLNFPDRTGIDIETHPSEAGRSFMLSKIPKPHQRTGCPITNLRWNAAVSYCAWLSRRTGGYYRLPTEREWDHVARAGRKGGAAWHKGNSGGRIHPAGETKPNAFGFHDLAGNAWEYCLEQDAPPHYRPVLRGGAWNDPPEEATPAGRTNVRPPWIEGDPNRPRSTWFLSSNYSQGFRVVRAAGPSDARARAAYAAKLELKVEAGEEHTHKNGKASSFFRHVVGTVRNAGDRPLLEVEILVYYLDEDEKPHVADVQPAAGKPGRATWGKCWPVLASAARDEAARAPLKPGETRAFAVDLPLSFDDAPDVDPEAFGARVTNLRFSDPKK